VIVSMKCSELFGPFVRRTEASFARRNTVRAARGAVLVSGAVAGAAAPAAAQGVLFSIDWQGPTISKIDTLTGLKITEGDVLAPRTGAPQLGPLLEPTVILRAMDLGLQQYGPCVGHPPGTPCGIEVDAISQGLDAPFKIQPEPGGRIWFSVDEYARGLPLIPIPGFPQVSSESFFGDSSSDVFTDLGLPPGPLPPGASLPRNVGAIDGNGTQSASGFTYPGLGLIEPNPPSTTPANPGDNVDALDIDAPAAFPPIGMYFSLDGNFPDPLTGLPNSGSAAIAGFSGAHVLRAATLGGPVTVYAQANQLGLDRFGPGTDDLDALILHENGDGIFQPSTMPYDWTNGTKDMLMFSVRRGSRVIGEFDSQFGIRIAEGDILVPPRAGGMSPFPAIWIAAENLGLRTNRGGIPNEFGDDLDALDHTSRPMFDCNKNGVEDSVDIATGTSSDVNGNGIPDECEADRMPYCWCPAMFAPCDNPDATAGCQNSRGIGGLMTSGGSTSVAADDLTFLLSQLPFNKSGIIYMSPDGQVPVPFGDGVKCPKGPAYRYYGQNSGASGTISYGPGLIAWAASHFGPPGHIVAGSTWHFQGWYRDPPGPCGSGANMTNAVRVTFGP
jgi:hypothetical protein